MSGREPGFFQRVYEKIVPPSNATLLRRQQRQLNKEAREAERMRSLTELQRERAEERMHAAAQRGDQRAVQQQAKSVVAARKCESTIDRAQSHINSVGTMIVTQTVNDSMVHIIDSTSKVLERSNKITSTDNLEHAKQVFIQANEKAAIVSKMTDDAISDDTNNNDTETLGTEERDLVDTVMQDVIGDSLSRLPSVPNDGVQPTIRQNVSYSQMSEEFQQLKSMIVGMATTPAASTTMSRNLGPTLMDVDATNHKSITTTSAQSSTSSVSQTKSTPIPLLPTTASSSPPLISTTTSTLQGDTK